MPHKLYTCHRCDARNPDYLTFETGWPDNIKYWCLRHIPRWTRFTMWIRGDR